MVEFRHTPPPAPQDGEPWRLTGFDALYGLVITHIDDQEARAHVEVETPAKGSKTIIESSDAAYDQHLDEGLFRTDALERGKP